MISPSQQGPGSLSRCCSPWRHRRGFLRRDCAADSMRRSARGFIQIPDRLHRMRDIARTPGLIQPGPSPLVIGTRSPSMPAYSTTRGPSLRRPAAFGEATRTGANQPGAGNRPAIAIFEAVNAIAGSYESYTKLIRARPATSVRSAIAQAAHDTLAFSIRRRRRSFDLSLAQALGDDPERPGQV